MQVSLTEQWFLDIIMARGDVLNNDNSFQEKYLITDIDIIQHNLENYKSITQRKLFVDLLKYQHDTLG